MPAFLLKTLSTWLLSKLAKDLAVDIVLITLRRWAASTDNTLDNEIVESIALNLKA